MLGCPKYASSHVAAQACNMLLLKHGTSLTQLQYFLKVDQCTNKFFILNKSIFKYGQFYNHLSSTFKDTYNVNFNRLTLDSLVSRVNFVQIHEPRSRFCSYFNI